MRPHLAAVYAYAATAGAIANQRSLPGAERIARLDAWQRRLHAAVEVERSGRAPDSHEDVVVAALASTVRSFDLPVALFDDLVSACGQDTMTARYDSWADLLDYCRRGANPLGRLILRVAGHRDETLDRSSDALCTALQLTALWREFSRDWPIGRLFVPRDVSAACRAREMDLDAPFLNDSWAAAIRQCVDQTRVQFAAGRTLCDALGGRLRYERRLAWLVGTRLLDQVERAGPSLRMHRPALGWRDRPRLFWRVWRWDSHF